MSQNRFQFTLPQVAAVCVWLAAVFAAAHYALRLRLDLTLAFFFVSAAGTIWLSIVMLGYYWIRQREALGSISLSRLLVAIASIVMSIGASVSAFMAILVFVSAFAWMLSLAFLTMSASLAAMVFLMQSPQLPARRRRKRARAGRARLAQLLIEGRALLDEQLPDEAAFADWQRQVAAWQAECERSLATWLTPRELAEIFAPGDNASIWIHRLHHEHEQALGNLDAWLDRLRVLHSSSRGA